MNIEKATRKVISILPIAIAVGCMTFITAWICAYMDWTIWLAFLSWALYFLHGGSSKEGFGALAAFIYGIALAQGALLYIEWLPGYFTAEWLSQYIVPSSVFLVAAVITLTMRLENSWASFIPAVYIGTVFRFAFIDLGMAHQHLDSIVTDLLFPIIFGLAIGWCTVSLLVWLDRMGLSQWHVRWEIE
ncbi:DUF1097 domain-containing protein [Motiliproteus sp. MSK22-1]|uniref:DUF1097 domain-containing protein n=1 Tax=Motiliproteus sp. MSK22-1 TaxID=1897630 RepID=UPI000976C0F4|nr:DUF1097 domain-containing protein [Motiliproteus sp. MSK22-1]OMH38928.1 hypothetical protein BGP75_00720 [Motiliproteus sp. MSK22-1]